MKIGLCLGLLSKTSGEVKVFDMDSIGIQLGLGGESATYLEILGSYLISASAWLNAFDFFLVTKH